MNIENLLDFAVVHYAIESNYTPSTDEFFMGSIISK